MSNSLQPATPNDTLALRQTNVSNPSIVHSRPSQQSITASEDYYSLSGSNSSTHSGNSANANANRASQSQQTITRYQTPPSRYRTPQQSRDVLPLPQQHAAEEVMGEEQFRQTPMRGHGKRRQSVEEGASQAAAEQPLFANNPTQPPQGQLREGGIRRKPVPSTVMEQDSARNSRISPTIAQSSVARDINCEKDAPTPGVDDAPFIHFALDQLTRDEEVRGSRRYPGIAPGIDGNYPYQVPANMQWPAQPQGARYQQLPQEEKDIAEQSPYMDDQQPKHVKQLSGQENAQAQRGPNVFIPVTQDESRQPPLHFVPGILRPLQLGLFAFLLLAYLICLIIAAAWSRANIALSNYGSFGDARYFVYQYLPTTLGMIILMWLFEVQKAAYRIAPFIAMGSEYSPSARIVAAKLPLHPRGFVLPYFGHFGAKLPIIGSFLFIAWLQLFSIPLLGSSFNVYQNGNENWHWVATQGVIWTVIALYVLLLAALVVLLVWLMRVTTGLKWDPRSLADMLVLLETSNALDGQGENVPQLGYFRTSHRPKEVFHTYGIADKPARMLEKGEDGRLREKRYSNPDVDADMGNPPRLSKDPILARDSMDEEALQGNHHGSALPWFLKPALALLWPIIAIVLLLAFLIVSYLPSTTITKGFVPMLPNAVNTMGFSSGNFLYSFIPTLLATLCLLFWMDIDNAYRKLAPIEALLSHDGEGDIPERTLLLSYTADLPGLATLSALFNADYRLAYLTLTTLLSTALPILASGIFWAQFYIPQQRVLISTHMPAYYALTVFVTLHALSYLAIYPPSTLRHTSLAADTDTFNCLIRLTHNSRLLQDIAFRNPVSKTDLVTRLLSSRPGSALVIPNAAAAASKISLADSVRGFGRARAAATGEGGEVEKAIPGASAKYALGRFVGRDGREFVGIDRVRN